MADFLAGRPQNQSIGAGLREYLSNPKDALRVNQQQPFFGFDKVPASEQQSMLISELLRNRGVGAPTIGQGQYDAYREWISTENQFVDAQKKARDYQTNQNFISAVGSVINTGGEVADIMGLDEDGIARFLVENADLVTGLAGLSKAGIKKLAKSQTGRKIAQVIADKKAHIGQSLDNMASNFGPDYALADGYIPASKLFDDKIVTKSGADGELTLGALGNAGTRQIGSMDDLASFAMGDNMPRSPHTPDAIIKQSPNPNLLPDFDVRAKRMQSPKYERPEIPSELIPEKFPDEGDMIPGFGQKFDLNMIRNEKGRLVPYAESDRIRWDRLSKEKIEQLKDMGYTDKYIEFKKFQAEKELLNRRIRNIVTGSGIAGITAFGVNELGDYLAQNQSDATATIPQSEPINLGTLYSDTATIDTTQQPLFGQYGNGGDSSMYNIERALDSADQSHRLQGGIGNVPVDQLLGYDSLLQRRKNLRGF